MVDYLSNALWTKEEIAFRKDVHEFCSKEIAPIADEIDKGPYPRELLSKIGKAGFMGVHHDRSVGGTERGLSYEIIVAEEISSVNGGLDMARMASTTLYGMPLARLALLNRRRSTSNQLSLVIRLVASV
ncbi:MAG: acyl-CoA dehydrogenase family protein [Candidatus Thorarchaeota archaeon]|jgi:alkylation response protein AidB-like acyl-CoA dehydrogenase